MLYVLMTRKLPYCLHATDCAHMGLQAALSVFSQDGNVAKAKAESLPWRGGF